ncbi:MAG: YdeI/OmpD-associated family protein [Gemmatimonadaceae bacterium]
MPEPTGIRFFAEPDEFRAWLVEFHESARELWVGFHKKGSGKPSITWPQSVDEALCFGWIDGIRKSLGEHSYVIRFTPRKRDSIWSNVNIARYEALRRSERMHPAGVRAYEARDEKKSGIYLFEQRDNPKLTAAELKQFRAKAAAWKFFQAQPPGYRRLATWWVISAKRAETRTRRLALLIKDSAQGHRIGALRQVTK